MLTRKKDWKPMTEAEARDFFIKTLAYHKANRDIQLALADGRNRLAYEEAYTQLIPAQFQVEISTEPTPEPVVHKPKLLPEPDNKSSLLSVVIGKFVEERERSARHLARLAWRLTIERRGWWRISEAS